MPRAYLTRPSIMNEGRNKELGDRVRDALSALGITDERVTEWIGKPCGCEERKEKLNQLSRWAKRVADGKTKLAYDYLRRMMNVRH